MDILTRYNESPAFLQSNYVRAYLTLSPFQIGESITVKSKSLCVTGHDILTVTYDLRYHNTVLYSPSHSESLTKMRQYVVEVLGFRTVRDFTLFIFPFLQEDKRVYTFTFSVNYINNHSSLL
jgi:hypothetical protein